MSSPEQPFVDEIAMQMCKNCPLRELGEQDLQEMAQDEGPYWFAEKLAEGRGVAASEGDVEALQWTFDQMPFSRDGQDYAQPEMTEFKLRGGLVFACEPNDGNTINVNRDGELVDSVPETKWPVTSRAVLACMRRAIDGSCEI